MILIQHGNLLDIQGGLIAHQVNLQGVMGAGLAKQIRDKYPEVYKEYIIGVRNKSIVLGDAQIIQVTPTLYVANLAAQTTCGREKGKCYTSYDALNLCLSKLNQWQKRTKLNVYLPYGLGCGLAGGNWNIVQEIIKMQVPNATIVKYSK